MPALVVPALVVPALVVPALVVPALVVPALVVPADVVPLVVPAVLALVVPFGSPSLTNLVRSARYVKQSVPRNPVSGVYTSVESRITAVPCWGSLVSTNDRFPTPGTPVAPKMMVTGTPGGSDRWPQSRRGVLSGQRRPAVTPRPRCPRAAMPQAGAQRQALNRTASDQSGIDGFSGPGGFGGGVGEAGIAQVSSWTILLTPCVLLLALVVALAAGCGSRP